MPVRVIRSDDAAWEEVPRPDGDTAPPGEEFVAFRSADGAFSAGMGRRVPEGGPREPPYHEIAFIVEGEVEVTDEDGNTHRAGPGDILITPNGTKAVWRALTPVKKFWAVYKRD